MEESRGIFGEECPSCDWLMDKPAFVNGDMAIIFITLDPKWYETANDVFVKTSARRRCGDEVAELLWVDEHHFQKLVEFSRVSGSSYHNVMWKKIQSFFRRCMVPGTFSSTRSIAIGLMSIVA